MLTRRKCCWISATLDYMYSTASYGTGGKQFNSGYFNP